MKRCGLTKKERLLKPFQFQSVYQQRRVRRSAFVWMYSSANGLNYNRLGISVSNKTCNNLVQRNRVKRLIRQVYREHKDYFGLGNDCVFVVKKVNGNPTYDDVKKNILNLASSVWQKS